MTGYAALFQCRLRLSREGKLDDQVGAIVNKPREPDTFVWKARGNDQSNRPSSQETVPNMKIALQKFSQRGTEIVVLLSHLPKADSSFMMPFQLFQGDNVRESLEPRWHLKITFDDTTSMMAPLREACETVDCRLPTDFPDHPLPYDLAEKVCEQFSNHGFCRKQRQGHCPLLHDVDFAIDLEQIRQERNRKKRKRRFDHLKPDSILEKERLEEKEKEARRERISVEDLKNKTK
ncbi:hypothetical protein COOONC_10732 [Cooperia oncophora]